MYFEFDPTYLQETIDNLLSNAVKYSSPKDHIVVTVHKNDNFVVTEIKDYGAGIPENELNNIFKVFSKASPQPTSGEHLSGLGLAIAKKVVEMHKGTIGVESTVDQGSTFHYSLPLL